MGLGLNQYSIQVRDHRSFGTIDNVDGEITSGLLVFVYNAGTKTLSTIYSDDKATAKTNAISRAQFATDGKITFYSASTSHDLFIAHTDGSVTRVAGVTPNTHSVKLNRDGLEKCVVFPMVFNAGGTETDTGIDLPKNTKIFDVLLEVVDVDATETVTIGLLSSETNGDADGLMLSTSVAVAGFFQLYSITDGTNEDFIATPRAGALMGLGSAGTDVANDFGQAGGPGHIVTGSNAVSISYQPSSSDTFTGYGYVFFRHLR